MKRTHHVTPAWLDGELFSHLFAGDDLLATVAPDGVAKLPDSELPLWNAIIYFPVPRAGTTLREGFANRELAKAWAAVASEQPEAIHAGRWVLSPIVDPEAQADALPSGLNLPEDGVVAMLWASPPEGELRVRLLVIKSVAGRWYLIDREETSMRYRSWDNDGQLKSWIRGLE